ncbi:hypothetical protein [Desulfoscipio gibsoniae]|uniref:Uncharacterized protein n=1 Tax=Desulfoscipio gibsoniae DSM 7213 TaxID=767817 RepID=R4KNN1_9FIRM|nr:hypothetical protein [Desulfoscipio gibsoniae]AGL03172.1 hypothetical protein Desgi_3862 [Desulfoscipio gibsoniae DSM 7213]
MKYVLPFHFVFEPMIRLAVISFKEDEEFEDFEPQFFDDPINGRGIRLLRYRKNGKVDVYYESGINHDESFSVGAGIADLKMTHFEKNFFEVTKNGLQVHLIFTDKQGRKNELKVIETSKRKRPVPLLAPIGGRIETPQKLFFVYMYDIDFAYRKTTQIHCSLDERVLEPATLPLLMNGQRTYLTRYCSKLTIVALNSNGSKPLCFDAIPGKIVIHDETEIHCDAQGKINQIQIGQGMYSAKLHFPGGFPNLLELPESECIKGSFDIYISSNKITEGQYQLMKIAEQVHVELNQFKKWHPGRYPLAYKLLVTFVKIFKNWPTKYSWKGKVELKEPSLMDGQWQNRLDKNA